MQLNTTSPNCTFHILVTDAWVGPYHANELYTRAWSRYPQRALAVIKATEFGDYAGGLAERSNHRVLAERAAELGLVQITGSHGYQALAYDATLGPVPASGDLAEILEGLEEYGLLDEDDESQIESDLEDEAWNDWGRNNFRSDFVDILNSFDDAEHEIPDDDDDIKQAINGLEVLGLKWKDVIDAVWRDGCQTLNVNGGNGYKIETGGAVYFYITEWCNKACRCTATSSLYDVLHQIALLCRIAE